MADYIIRKATPEDLKTLNTLVNAHKKELGFVRKVTLAHSIAQQEILVAEMGEYIVGFVRYHHRRDIQTTLYDIVVAPSQRLSGIGKALIENLKQEARLLGKQTILLKCPVGLPANEFYRHLGGQIVRDEPGKQRPLNVWQFIL